MFGTEIYYLYDRCVEIVYYNFIPHSSVVKNLPVKAGDTRDAGSIPGSGRSPEEGNGNPLQYSCLKNPMERGAWQAIVLGVARVRHSD